MTLMCLRWPTLSIRKYSSLTANPEQLCSSHPPRFEDAPHRPSNRHSASNNPPCDCSQTQAKWPAQTRRRLVVERRSKCMSSVTTYPQSCIFAFTVTRLIYWSPSFHLHLFYLLSVAQKPESNEQRQNGLKMVDQAIWSKKMSNGVRRTPVSAEQVCV